MTETAGKFTGFGILWLIDLINMTITTSKTHFLNHFISACTLKKSPTFLAETPKLFHVHLFLPWPTIHAREMKRRRTKMLLQEVRHRRRKGSENQNHQPQR